MLILCGRPDGQKCDINAVLRMHSQSHGKKANPCDCEGIDVAFLSVELSLLFLGSVSRIKVDILP